MKELANLSRVCDNLKDELYILHRQSVMCDERDAVSYSGDVACQMDAVEIMAGGFSKMLMKLYGGLILYNTDRTIDIDKQ